MGVERWIFGFIISLLIGDWSTEAIVDSLRRGKRIKQAKDSQVPIVPGQIVGYLERTFFTFAIAVNIPGAFIGMFAWIGAKMLANWKYKYEKGMSDEMHWMFERTALYGSLISMFFALLGGLICRGKPW